MKVELLIANPKELTRAQMDNIAEFVAQFGQVEMSFILAGLPKANSIGFINVDNEIVSVGVLKNPNESYIKSTYKKAGLDLPDFSIYEYGYAGTSPDFRGKGFSSAILKQLLNTLPINQKVFATVRENNDAEIHVLEKHGFVKVGSKYLNARGEYYLKLYEFTKKQTLSFRMKF